MGKIARAMTALLSAFMVFAPISASACDLSCWLDQANSDCHSAGQFTGGNQNSLSAPAMMDMSAEGEMSSHGAQDSTDFNASAIMHHSPTEQMSLAPRPVEVARTDASSTSRFDPSKKLSRCSHESCSQASASPPKVRGDQPAYLHPVAIDGLNPANFSTNSYRTALGTSPPLTPAADLLITLRI